MICTLFHSCVYAYVCGKSGSFIVACHMNDLISVRYLNRFSYRHLKNP